MKTDTSHHTSLDQLEALFARQIANAGVMLDLLVAEHEALTAADIEKLLAVALKKDQQAQVIKKIDRGIKTAAQLIAGEPAKEVRFNDLEEHLEPGRFRKLAATRSSIARLKEKIETKNLFNKRFAEEMQLFVKDAMALISNASTRPCTYGNAGRNVKTGNGPTFISRAV